VGAIHGSALMKYFQIAADRDLRGAEFTRERIYDDAAIAINAIYNAPAPFLIQHASWGLLRKGVLLCSIRLYYARIKSRTYTKMFLRSVSAVTSQTLRP
jgi:hypothetical protein